MYSISDPSSLLEAEQFIQKIHLLKCENEQFDFGYQVPCVLLGNKRDLDDIDVQKKISNKHVAVRSLTRQQGQELAAKYGIIHFAESSALLDDIKIDAAFGELAMMICKQKVFQQKEKQEQSRGKRNCITM